MAMTLEMLNERIEALTVILTKKVEDLESRLVAKIGASVDKKVEDLESRLVAKIEASVDKKVKATGLKKDGTSRKQRDHHGYILQLLLRVRAEIHAELAEEVDGENVPPGAVVKRLAELWNELVRMRKELSDDEKEALTAKAKEAIEAA